MASKSMIFRALQYKQLYRQSFYANLDLTSNYPSFVVSFYKKLLLGLGFVNHSYD